MTCKVRKRELERESHAHSGKTCKPHTERPQDWNSNSGLCRCASAALISRMNDAAKSFDRLTVKKNKKKWHITATFRKHFRLWPTNKDVALTLFFLCNRAGGRHNREKRYWKSFSKVKYSRALVTTQQTLEANSPKTCLKQFGLIYSVPQILQHAARGDTSDCWRCDFRRFFGWHVWDQDGGSEHVS